MELEFNRSAFLLRFALLSSFMGTSVGLAKFTTTLYAIHLGASGWVLSAMAGAQSIGILFMSIPVGFWVERLGPQRLFITGSWIMGLLYVLIPAVASPLFLLVLTALISFLMPMRFISLSTVFMAALDKLGHAQAGWQRGAHMSGMFLIGPVLASWVIHSFQHAGSYWLIAAMFVVTAVLARPLLHTPSTGNDRRASALSALRELWGQPGIRNLSYIEFAIQAAHMYYAFYIVVIAVQQLHFPTWQAGSLVAIQGGAFIVSLVVLGRIFLRFGTRKTVALGTTLSSLALLCIGLASSLAALWIGAACLGAGLGILQIHTLTQFAQWGKALGRGRVAGLSALAGPLGAFCGGLVGGSLGAAVGLQEVFVALAVFIALVGGRAITHAQDK